ncbi:MAG: hypothetical protein ACRDZP_02535 [Acidimicrobiales bacterium]
MKKYKLRTPLMIGLGVIGASLAVPGVALAQGTGATTYQANLQPVPLNGQNNASGSLTLSLNGNVATIHEQVSGLASTFMGSPFPHVQHIHINAEGTCPTASADTNHDGVISTSEGQTTYGAIGTTLSVSGSTTPAAGTNVKIAPSGSSFTYNRTITLDQATLASVQAGKAAIVVHGLDPATAPKAASTEKSPLVPSLPLAATAPAVCGTLVAMPSGAPGTGAGGTSGIQHDGLLTLGGLLVAGGAGTLVYRRRQSIA